MDPPQKGKTGGLPLRPKEEKSERRPPGDLRGQLRDGDGGGVARQDALLPQARRLAKNRGKNAPRAGVAGRGTWEKVRKRSANSESASVEAEEMRKLRWKSKQTNYKDLKS